jgi:transposase InsO family protein
MRRPAPGLIHHADRGSLYCAADYQAELRKHGLLISMSCKGNCYDNLMVESFFKTLKSELVWRTMLETRGDAERAINHYIDSFYNLVGRHSALGFRTPVKFKKMAINLSKRLFTKAGKSS